jgi:5S rRNA maturation endonuclease (ribonuclease M5)
MSDKDKQWDVAKELGKNSQALMLALTLAGKVNEDATVVLCPKCGKSAQVGKKFKMFPDGGWKHFSSDGCFGDAHTVLVEHGISFPDAVRFLAGQKTRSPIERPEKVLQLQVSKFEAVYDPEVFAGVLIYGRKTGGVQAAQEFYSQWHISPEAVSESGAVVITDAKHFTNAALERFGPERLRNSGLFVETVHGLRSLVGGSFPVVEPHLDPVTSVPTYMQFRASTAQAVKHAEHKAGRAPYAGSEKFLSVRGTGKESQIGMGLPHLLTLPTDSEVFIVEGFKDLLAARTLGVQAYAVPGVSFRPPESVVEILKRFRVVVALDGDDAGTDNRDALAALLESKGVRARTHTITDGHDVADKLVLRHAKDGCRCDACSAMTANERHTAVA